LLIRSGEGGGSRHDGIKGKRDSRRSGAATAPIRRVSSCAIGTFTIPGYTVDRGCRDGQALWCEPDSTGIAAGVRRPAEARRESGSAQSEDSENGTGRFSGISRARRQAGDQLQRRSGVGARRQAAAGTEVHCNNRAGRSDPRIREPIRRATDYAADAHPGRRGSGGRAERHRLARAVMPGETGYRSILRLPVRVP